MISIEQYKEDLLALRVRGQGNTKNIKYRKIKANPNNIRLLADFDRELSVTDIKETTRRGYLVVITNFLEYIGSKELKEVTQNDIISYLEHLKTKFKESSKQLYHSKLKKFMLWANGGKEYPECLVEKFKTKKTKILKLPEDIPTEEEVKRLIEVADNPRDKALISVLFESAMRIHSLVNMKIGDLRFDDYGVIFTARDTKTGDRPVRLVHSVPALKMWLNSHPDKNNPDAPLWLIVTKYAHLKQETKSIEKAGIVKLLKRLTARAGIKKNITPHLLRHRRLTELAKVLPESILRKIAGWTANSSMPEVYIHYNGEDVDKLLLTNAYNKPLSKKEKEATELFKPISCPVCKVENDVTNDFCYNCYNPLTEKATTNVKVLTSIVGKVLAVLSQAGKVPNTSKATDLITKLVNLNSRIAELEKEDSRLGEEVKELELKERVAIR